MEISIDTIKNEAKTALIELLDAAKLEEGDIFVVGCSTSEVLGEKVGTFSSTEVGDALFEVIYPELKKRGIHLAVQCCEHLNRSLIVEKRIIKENGLTRVNVVPSLHAGGAFAMAAYREFDEPAAVMEVRAKAGMDIGGVLIGMHLVPVAVPVRASVNVIGKARLTLARTRVPFAGGERALYEDSLR